MPWILRTDYKIEQAHPCLIWKMIHEVKKMKRRVLAFCVLMVGLSLLVNGTLAYFTKTDTATNVITTGNVDIEIVETMKDDRGKEVPFPAEGLSGVMPDTSASKIVRVKNTGSSEAWIRVNVGTVMTSKDGKSLDASVMGWNHPSDLWALDKGGQYFYYTKPVAPGESTEALFETVFFAAKMSNEYQDCTANVIVSAQAVQTAHNGSTVWEAAGWPKA